MTDLQDLYMDVRAHRRAGQDVPAAVVSEWEDRIKVIDKVSRDRLFILTVAAEKGWAVAADLAAGMRGIALL
jgi:hypothetical protein